MRLSLKDYLSVCFTPDNAYYSTTGHAIHKIDSKGLESIARKHKNRAAVLLHNYQLTSVDYPPGTDISTAKKITSFKLKELLDVPVTDCVYDVLNTHDEQNTGRFYVLSASKSDLALEFTKYNISNFKCIDIFENALRNTANTLTTSSKASLVVFVFENYSYILLMYKHSILSYRKLEVSTKDFDLWISEIQRSADIFERQFRFTSVDETLVINLDDAHHDNAKILLKDPKFITDKPQNDDTPLDVHMALKGLALRL